MKRITGLLQEWGLFVAANIDYADEWGDSILAKMVMYGGYTERGDSGSAILCEDMPMKIKRVDHAVKRLPRWQRDCIQAFYCSPLKEDGQVWTKRELAKLLGTTKDKFDSHISYGKRRLNTLLEG